MAATGAVAELDGMERDSSGPAAHGTGSGLHGEAMEEHRDRPGHVHVEVLCGRATPAEAGGWEGDMPDGEYAAVGGVWRAGGLGQHGSPRTGRSRVGIRTGCYAEAGSGLQRGGERGVEGARVFPEAGC